MFNPTIHYTTALTPEPSEEPKSLVMTVTNSGNISSLEYFELVMTRNPYSVITGDPIPFQVTVNGTNVDLYNKYSLPIYTNRLNMRKRYYGSYVAPEDGEPYVILWNTPNNPAYATPNLVETTTATASDTGTDTSPNPSVTRTTKKG